MFRIGTSSVPEGIEQAGGFGPVGFVTGQAGFGEGEVGFRQSKQGEIGIGEGFVRPGVSVPAQVGILWQSIAVLEIGCLLDLQALPRVKNSSRRSGKGCSEKMSTKAEVVLSPAQAPFTP